MSENQNSNFLSLSTSAWQMLAFGLLAGLVLVTFQIFTAERRDYWKEPILQSPIYNFVGDCQKSLKNSRYIPLSCAQPQYEVESSYYIHEYGLPQLHKATRWYRIGNAAAMLGCTSVCRIDDIRQGGFRASCEEAGVLVASPNASPSAFEKITGSKACLRPDTPLVRVAPTASQTERAEPRSRRTAALSGCGLRPDEADGGEPNAMIANAIGDPSLPDPRTWRF